jgi:hypothetical protein
MRIPTYDQITGAILRRYGVTISHSCHIADVKEEVELTRWRAWNRQEPRANPCPERLRPLIRNVIRQLLG